MESTRTHKIIALLGIAMLAIGVFLPVEKFLDESSAFFDVDNENDIPADGPGVYILILAAISLLLIGKERLEYLWLPAVITFWALFPSFTIIWNLAIERHEMDRIGVGWVFLLGGPIVMTSPRWFTFLRQASAPISDEPEELTLPELIEDERFDDQ